MNKLLIFVTLTGALLCRGESQPEERRAIDREIRETQRVVAQIWSRVERDYQNTVLRNPFKRIVRPEKNFLHMFKLFNNYEMMNEGLNSFDADRLDFKELTALRNQMQTFKRNAFEAVNAMLL